LLADARFRTFPYSPYNEGRGGMPMPMKIIETRARVGSDGMLRLEVPVERCNQDVQVALIIESPSATPPELDRWAPVRGRLEAAGIRVPPPGLENPGPVEPESLPGPSASEILIRDRR
jgi:hypothetical protein